MNANISPKRIGALIVLMLAVGVLYAGCSEVAKYRVLSFFFDGVSPPEGMEPQEIAGPGGKNGREGEGGAAETGEPAKPKVFFYHAAWRNEQCFQCHDAQGSYQLIGPDAEVCRKCHGAYFQYEESDWAHAPAASGQCSFCHEPHKSQYQHLLKAPETDLCWKCHQASDVLKQPYHQAAEQAGCSKCHDLHLAGNRLLLADSRTYRRRKKPRQAIVPRHTQWTRDDCAKCHIVEQSYKLMDSIDPVCLSCHQNVLEPAEGQNIHAPVRQKQCVLCHTPHKSILPHLIRPSAEQICYNCHELEEIRTSTHPKVHRADCLLCHAGHHSGRSHLLKPDVPVDR